MNNFNKLYQYYGDNQFALCRLKQAGASDPSIILFPHAGASSLAYHKFADALPDNLNISAIDLPGHLLTKEGNYTSIQQVVSGLLDLIPAEEFYNAIIFGHSFGGYLAYETCIQLKRHSVTPQGLIISCSLPMHVAKPFDSHHVDDETLIQLLIADEKQKEDTHKIRELNADFIGILRNDLAWYETYLPTDKLYIPTTIISADNDSVCRFDIMYQWRKWIPKAKLNYVSGDHLYILSPEAETINTLNTSIIDLSS